MGCPVVNFVLLAESISSSPEKSALTLRFKIWQLQFGSVMEQLLKKNITKSAMLLNRVLTGFITITNHY